MEIKFTGHERTFKIPDEKGNYTVIHTDKNSDEVETGQRFTFNGEVYRVKSHAWGLIGESIKGVFVTLEKNPPFDHATKWQGVPKK